MISFLVIAWPGVIAAIAWRGRPHAVRGRAVHARSAPLTSRSRRSPIEHLGRWVRSRARRPTDRALDRRLGWSLMVGAVLGAFHPMLVPAAVGVWLAGRWQDVRKGRRHEREIFDDGPEIVDLMLLAVEAGCTPRLALEATATWGSGPWQDALCRVVAHVDHGERFADALVALEVPLGDVARPLVVALRDAEHYGVPLVPALERLGSEMSVERRRRADERARRLPVQLLFPLVFCTLPAFVMLTVVPLLADTLSTLSI